MSKLKHELRILRDENQKLRNEVDRVRKDYTILRSALGEIVDLSSSSPMINDIARKALFELGTTGCSAGPIGVDGLTKYVQTTI
ncbi:hypothetical protein [Lactococcus lactis]|uniref:hypothetical protein n=1 Tax=Lactococcus lactis TaxID=1358 RepID=UPI003FD22C42